ncbi:hypothetical protein T484DRAFT_1890205, partial [Baffinella frigidus]
MGQAASASKALPERRQPRGLVLSEEDKRLWKLQASAHLNLHGTQLMAGADLTASPAVGGTPKWRKEVGLQETPGEKNGVASVEQLPRGSKSETPGEKNGVASVEQLPRGSKSVPKLKLSLVSSDFDNDPFHSPAPGSYGAGLSGKRWVGHISPRDPYKSPADALELGRSLDDDSAASALLSADITSPSAQPYPRATPQQPTATRTNSSVKPSPRDPSPG